MMTRIIFLLMLAGAYLWSVDALNQQAQQSLRNVSNLYTQAEVLSAEISTSNK